MRRPMMFINVVVAIAAVGVGVLAAAGSNAAVAALAIALAVWILLATRLGAALNAARADRQLVIDSWTAYANGGMNALERARRIREHFDRAAAEGTTVHADGFPCGAIVGMSISDPAVVNCPLCVAVTEFQDVR